MFETLWFTIIIIIIPPLGIGLLLIREGMNQSFHADTGALWIGNITYIIGLLPRLVQVCRCFPVANVISHNYELGRTQRCEPGFEPMSSSTIISKVSKDLFTQKMRYIRWSIIINFGTVRQYMACKNV